MVRGHPINPQQAASYPLYKVIFLVPALSRVRAPSKFPTIDRTTRDHCYDQSALGLLRKAQYEFHVSWLNLLRRSELNRWKEMFLGEEEILVIQTWNTGAQCFSKIKLKKIFQNRIYVKYFELFKMIEFKYIRNEKWISKYKMCLYVLYIFIQFQRNAFDYETVEFPRLINKST